MKKGFLGAKVAHPDILHVSLWLNSLPGSYDMGDRRGVAGKN